MKKLLAAAIALALPLVAFADTPPVAWKPNGANSTACYSHTGALIDCGGAPASVGASSALATSKVLKNSAGTLYSFEVNADATLSAAAWYVLILNATADPGNGAVTPYKCFGAASGTAQLGGTYASGGVSFPTGIVIVVSTTGCFTETQSAHAYISGDFQ